jgi:uncharacterized alkaline shock family protein YloU
MIISVWPKVFDSVSYFVKTNILNSSVNVFLMFFIALIFFTISTGFLFSGLRKSAKDKKVISKYTNVGEITISLDAIENITLAVTKKFTGVRDAKADVRKFNDTVAITIKAVVMPELNIPLLSEDMQVKVKKTVEETAGVNVNSVKVFIDNIYTGYKSRVE